MECLKKGRLKKETERYVCGSTIPSIKIKRIIDKQNVSAKCRMCRESDETVSPIVLECTKLAQKQY